MWGTLAGVEILGGIANTRDLGPALGGLLGGPVVGLGAGLIGGAAAARDGRLRRRCRRPWAPWPPGVAGGAVFLLYKRRVAPVWAAMLLAVFTESVLMGLNLLMARPFDQVLPLVREVILPMILVNAIGMGLFVFIVRNEERERETAAQKERMEGELTVAREIQRSHRARPSSRRSPSARSSTCTPRWSRRARWAATSTTSSCSTTTTCAWPSATSPARACRPRCSWP